LKEEKNILSETNKVLEQRLEKHEARNHQIFSLEHEISKLRTDLENEKVTVFQRFVSSNVLLFSKLLKG